MIHGIQQVCGHRLPLSALFTGATIEYLASALMQQGAETFRSPLTAIQPGGSRAPFVFLHGDFNGGGFYCRGLAHNLGPEQPFYALHPHGLDGGPVPPTIEAMAEDHLRTLRAFRPKGPYLLGGHCNGGLVAFEMARRLQAQGERVDLLVLLDASARNVRFRVLHQLASWLATARRLGPADQLELFLSLRHYSIRLHDLLRAGIREQAVFLQGNIRRCGAKLLELCTRCGKYGRAEGPGRPSATGAGGPGGLDAVYRRAVASYMPRAYRGRITLFRSQEDTRDGFEFEWHKIAKEMDVHVVPGRHITSITHHVQIVAEKLRTCLESTQAF
jgi:thioesterase domain-containing protein